MEYRNYKGRKTAALGFGGMRFENPGDIDSSVETVLRAYEKGITYFDTAPDYCDDKSEIIIGEAIKEMKKGSSPFTISTKSSKADGAELREQLEESLKRLNVDTIDYYNCWYVLTKKDWENRKKGGAVDAILKVHKDQSMLEAALHFLLSDSRITVPLVGFRNKNDVDTAVAAVESFKPYTKDEIRYIQKKVQNEFNQLCTTCMYCDVCPEGIPVWKFMETHNHLKLKGSELVSDRLKWHWGTDISELDRCTSCLKCEKACTQKLPIIDRFKELKKVVNA